MGEMADFYLEQQEEGGRNLRPGDPYRPRINSSRPAMVKCKHCGKVCKWRLNDQANWQLQELERGAHNRNVWHDCRNQCSVDDFDVIEN